MRLGRAVLAEAMHIVEDSEASHEDRLGRARLIALKASLSSLLDRIDPVGTLG